jgi:hypothetical protein
LQEPRQNVLAGNSLTAINVRQTHCSMGHLLGTDDNVMPSQNGRACKTCNRNHSKESNRLIGAAAAKLGLGVREYKRIHGQSRYKAMAFLEKAA